MMSSLNALKFVHREKKLHPDDGILDAETCRYKEQTSNTETCRYKEQTSNNLIKCCCLTQSHEVLLFNTIS